MRDISCEKLLIVIEALSPDLMSAKILDICSRVERTTWSKSGIMKHNNQFLTISKALLATLTLSQIFVLIQKTMDKFSQQVKMMESSFGTSMEMLKMIIKFLISLDKIERHFLVMRSDQLKMLKLLLKESEQQIRLRSSLEIR